MRSCLERSVFLDTILPDLLSMRSAFINPPFVLFFVPFQTDNFARGPVAIIDTFMAFFMAFFMMDFFHRFFMPPFFFIVFIAVFAIFVRSKKINLEIRKEIPLILSQ